MTRKCICKASSTVTGTYQCTINESHPYLSETEVNKYVLEDIFGPCHHTIVLTAFCKDMCITRSIHYFKDILPWRFESL